MKFVSGIGQTRWQEKFAISLADLVKKRGMSIAKKEDGFLQTTPIFFRRFIRWVSGSTSNTGR